ncbi:MAG: glycosyltransferase family 4 protein [Bacteroidetes bacterium]|nr:glycosyltransferase family 4 protein [Bacteroidota bacterium]
MNILLINNVHYNRGGADKVYLNTGRLMAEHGHKVSYFAINNPENLPSEYSRYFLSNPDFKHQSVFAKLKSFPRYFFSGEAQRNLQQLITEQKPALAHIHLLYGGGLTSSILPVLKKNKIPVVLTIHDYKLLCPVLTLMDNSFNICEQCAGGNYAHCILKLCNQITLSTDKNLFNSLIFSSESWFRDIFYHYNRYVSRYIFVSEFSRNIHARYKPFFAAKSQVLFNFIDFSDKEKPIHARGDYYLFFGRLSKEKGILTLLDAFSEMQDSKLLIIGNGELAADIQTYITGHQTQNITLLGYKTGEELKSYISGSRFVMLPSQWYENNPLSVIEAFRLGKPVLGASIGGIPELVKEGETGYLFNPGSVMSIRQAVEKANAITDQEYAELSHNSYEFAFRNFNAESHYASLMELYESLQS